MLGDATPEEVKFLKGLVEVFEEYEQRFQEYKKARLDEAREHKQARHDGDRQPPHPTPRPLHLVGAPTREWLTAEQAADYLQVKVRRIYDWVREGRLLRHKAGQRLRFRLQELDAYLDRKGRGR